MGDTFKDYNFSRSQKLLVRDLPDSIKSFYEDLQEDFKKYMPLMVLWGQNGHMLEMEDGTAKVVSPQEAHQKCLSMYKNEEIVAALKVAISSGSFYGLFYKDYGSNDGVKKQGKRWEYIQKLRSLTDEQFEEGKSHFKNTVSDERFDELRKEAIAGILPDQLWASIADDISDKTIRSIALIRQKFNFPAKRENNYNYCMALSHMLQSYYKSWEKLNEDRIEERKGWAEAVDEQKGKMPEIYNLVCRLEERLSQINYGFSKRIFFKALNDFKKGRKNSWYQPVVDLLGQEEFKKLIVCDGIVKVLDAKNFEKQLKKRTPFIFLREKIKDYVVPFGLSGRGQPFSLTVENDLLNVKIGSDIFKCCRSNYFHNLSVEPTYDKGGKRLDGYFLKYNHKTKIRSKNSQVVPSLSSQKTGQLCELGLHKKNGKFYLYLSHSRPMNRTANGAKFFFQTAHPTKGESYYNLPDCLKLAAFDLNLSDPLSMTKATLHKGKGHGPVEDEYYGTGKITFLPQVVVKDTSFARRIGNHARTCDKLKDVIKAYKSDKGVSQEMERFLRKCPYSNRDIQNNRYFIQTWVGHLNKKIKEVRRKVWLSGYRELSEAFMLLKLEDAFYSLCRCYDNIHIRNANVKPVFHKKDGDQTRRRLRLHVSRLLAASVVRFSGDSDIIFIEDLSTGFKEGDNNSLSRLFSPGQLKKCIESACEKADKGCVFVCPNGTSQKDPITGWHGFRPKKRKDVEKTIIPQDKRSNYVIRDNELCLIEDDPAASLNVLLVGLSHGVGIYKFYVNKGKISKNGDVEESDKVRLTRFLEANFGAKKSELYFAANEKEVVVCKAKPIEQAYTGWVYICSNKLLSESQKNEHVNRIKLKINDRLMCGEEIPKIDANVYTTSRCNAFSAKYILDET